MSTISAPSSFSPAPRLAELPRGRNQPTRRLRRAKIVAPLGPASASRDCIHALFEAGVDVFRLNFSHGSHDDHRKLFDAIRRIEHHTGRPIGILADMQGPKLRLGDFAHGAGGGGCAFAPRAGASWPPARIPVSISTTPQAIAAVRPCPTPKSSRLSSP